MQRFTTIILILLIAYLLFSTPFTAQAINQTCPDEGLFAHVDFGVDSIDAPAVFLALTEDTDLHLTWGNSTWLLNGKLIDPNAPAWNFADRQVVFYGDGWKGMYTEVGDMSFAILDGYPTVYFAFRRGVIGWNGDTPIYNEDCSCPNAYMVVSRKSVDRLVYKADLKVKIFT